MHDLTHSEGDDFISLSNLPKSISLAKLYDTKKDNLANAMHIVSKIIKPDAKLPPLRSRKMAIEPYKKSHNPQATNKTTVCSSSSLMKECPSQLPEQWTRYAISIRGAIDLVKSCDIPGSNPMQMLENYLWDTCSEKGFGDLLQNKWEQFALLANLSGLNISTHYDIKSTATENGKRLIPIIIQFVVENYLPKQTATSELRGYPKSLSYSPTP